MIDGHAALVIFDFVKVILVNSPLLRALRREGKWAQARQRGSANGPREGCS